MLLPVIDARETPVKRMGPDVRVELAAA